MRDDLMEFKDYKEKQQYYKQKRHIIIKGKTYKK